MQDFEEGHLYALEKLWAFHQYSGLPKGTDMTINPKVCHSSCPYYSEVKPEAADLYGCIHYVLLCMLFTIHYVVLC